MDRALKGMPELIREMCEGSAEAFDLVYARYMPFILHVALRVVGDRMEAEDICHDVFLEVLRKGAGYDPSRGSVEAWLAVMTRSRCLDRLRRSKRMSFGLEQNAEPQSASSLGPEAQAESRLQREALVEALHSLPLRQREAIVSSYYGSHTQRELSDAWNVPIGTVKSWVRYGIQNIRKQMQQRGWSQEQGERVKEAEP